MVSDRALQSLVDLGFTPMEAQVYTTLLAESPMSGYSVAKKLGKPAAYVYRAVDALEKKGALLKEEGSTRMLRATPLQEFIGQLNREHNARLEKAQDVLSSINREDWDDKIYTMGTIEQTFERVHTMLDRAKDIIYLDLYPKPYELFHDALDAAAKRGVHIRAIVYEPVDSDKVQYIRASAGKRIEHWPRQWLRIAVDGSEFLNALLTSDGTGLHHAIWSANPVQAWLAYYSLGLETQLHELTGTVRSDGTLEEIHKLINEWSSPPNSTPPHGIKRFQEYFGWGTGEAKGKAGSN